MNGAPFAIGRSVVAAPYIDNDTAQVVDDALEMLRIMRSGEVYNTADHLTALVSLAAQAQALIPDAVAETVDQGYAWAQIAHCLGLSVSAARRRYAARTPDRKTEPPLD